MKCFYNKKGVTLIEIIIGIALLSILVVSMLTHLTTSYRFMILSKDITKALYTAQERIESQLFAFSDDDIEIGDPEVEIFGKDIKYKVLNESTLGDRLLTAYMSKGKLGSLPVPKIEDLELRAYNSSGSVIFPWYDDINRLEVSYNASDSNIFRKSFSWFMSEEDAANRFIYNPRFQNEYLTPKQGNDLEFLTTQQKRLEKSELEENRYYYFGITPYSTFGRLGPRAMNDRRLPVVHPTPGSSFWKSLAEDVYFSQIGETTSLTPPFYLKNYDKQTQIEILNLHGDPLKLTLNIENDSSEPDNGLLFFRSITGGNHNAMSMTVSAQLDPDIMSNPNVDSAGFGLFLGDASGLSSTIEADKKETGHLILFTFDAAGGDHKISSFFINEGVVDTDSEVTVFTAADLESITSGFWDNEIESSVFLLRDDDTVETGVDGDGNPVFENVERYKLSLTVNGQSEDIRYYADNTVSVPSEYTEPLDQISWFNVNYMGLKTWSEGENYISDTIAEEKYLRNWSTHFYSIVF